MPPPKNPVTLKINGWLVENYLNSFMNRYLPAYTFRETSGYRDVDVNRDAGGVIDSSHLYNLAKDGNLVNIASNEIISEEEGKKLYDEYFVRYWEGYTEFSPETPTKRWHIHANIDRGFTHYTKWAGILGGAIVGGIFLKKLINKKE
ncbi:MAG: hypothetical protein KAR38_04060 [Calditrichia bacterium]|nr:hypothetical protein [Calditrichia bacterium]